MFIEKLEDVHESMHDQMVEHELDGKKGYIHKTDVPLINSLKNAKEERAKLQGDFSEVNERLANFEQQQKTAIEKARQEALEEARSKGDVAAIEKRYQEQMQDLEKRTAERVRGEVEQEFSAKFTQEQAEKELISIVAALNPLDDDAAEDLKMLLKSRQQVTEDNKIIYLNADGSASTLDNKGFIEWAKQQARFKRLRKADHVVSGGEKMNGSNGGSAPSTTNEKALAAKKKGDIKGYLDEAVKLNFK